MAERRMFAKTIIGSDAFLDMPSSTQNLYFHLGMSADDDGFVNSPRKIQRMVGGGEDDLKLLIAKNFVIPFASGVVVIKHWKIHNYIQSDRYKPSLYTKEKAQLSTKDNKGYTLLENVDKSTMYPECIQGVYTGKVRLGKSKVRLVTKRTPVPYNEIIDLFNEICVSLPRVQKVTDKRKEKIKCRYLEFKGDLDCFRNAFTNMEESDFIKGKNNMNWNATFDWLFSNDLNMVKVLEGNYKNKQTSSNPFKDILKEMVEDEQKGTGVSDGNDKDSVPRILPPEQ